MRRFTRRLLRALALFVLVAPTAAALPPAILVVLSEDDAAYRETGEALIATLNAGTGITPRIRLITLSALNERETSDAELIVPIGTRAAQAVAALQLPAPVLDALVPMQVYNRIVSDPSVRDRSKLSAVFLDQPLERHLRLIKVALPRRNRIGVVLSSDLLAMVRPLAAAAKQFGLQVRWEAIDDQSDVLAALERVLADSDLLFGISDIMVFNRETVQAILLTSYRYHDPVITYSQAYVNAGALAAVYTTPMQAGRQTAEAVREWLTAARLPPPRFPKYFTVSVNYHVAESLGLEIDSESVLLEKMERAERNP